MSVTNDQLTETVLLLQQENIELKNTLQTNNRMMKEAHELFANFQQRVSRERTEQTANYEHVKDIVTGLKTKIKEQEQVIAMMSQQAAELSQTTVREDTSGLHAQVSSMTSDLYLKTSQIAQMMQERESLVRNFETARADVLTLTESLQNARKEIRETAVDYYHLLDVNEELKKKELDTKELLQRTLSQKKEHEASIDNLTAQLISAEDTLQLKDANIRAKTKQIEELTVMAAQADIYKQDFSLERQSREQLNDVKIELEDHVKVLQERLRVLEIETNTRTSPGHRAAGPPETSFNHIARLATNQLTESYVYPLNPQHYPQLNNPRRPEASCYQETRPPPESNDEQFLTTHPHQNITGNWQQSGQIYPHPRHSPDPEINLKEDPSSGSFSAVPIAVQSAARIIEDPQRVIVHPSNNESPDHTAFHTTVIPDHICPFCNHVAPDLDSLNLHINDSHPE